MSTAVTTGGDACGSTGDDAVDVAAGAVGDDGGVDEARGAATGAGVCDNPAARPVVLGDGVGAGAVHGCDDALAAGGALGVTRPVSGCPPLSVMAKPTAAPVTAMASTLRLLRPGYRN